MKQLDKRSSVAVARHILEQSVEPVSAWLQMSLLIAGVYNILWGLWVVLFPNGYFSLSGVATPLYPEIWQCLGMVIGLYGLAYIIASTDVLRYWPIVLIGLLGKIFGPIGFFYTQAMTGEAIGSVWMLVFNDFIWWPSFFLILYQVYQGQFKRGRLTAAESEMLEKYAKLLEESEQRPLVLLLTRHLGCTFTRTLLRAVEEERHLLDQNGARFVLVHMGAAEQLESLQDEFGGDFLEAISDPSLSLYRIFSIPKANLWQVVQPRSWYLAWLEGFKKQCSVGWVTRDGFQLAGAARLQGASISKVHATNSVFEIPPIRQLI